VTEHRRSSLDLLGVSCSVTLRDPVIALMMMMNSATLEVIGFAFFSPFVFAVITDYDYVFSENGLVAHKNGQLIGTQVSLWAPYIVTYTVSTYMHWSTSPDISF